MSKWVDRIAEHEVHEKIESFLETLKQTSEDLNGDRSVSEAIARLKHIVDIAKRSISQADPILLAPSTLSNICNNIQKSAAYVSNFLADKNEQHLENANNELDNVMPSINRILINPNGEDISSLSKTIKSFLDTANTQVANLENETKNVLKQIANLNQKIANLNEKITQERSRIDQAVTQHQQQFSEAQNSRQKNFDDNMQERLKRIEVTQTTWDSKFSSMEDVQKQKFDKLIEALKDSDERFKKDVANDSEKMIDELKIQCQKAKKIVGIISGTGMAGGYQKDSDKEWWSWLVWSFLAVGGLFGLVIFALILFFGSGAAEFSWQELIAKLLAIGAFGGLATYAGRMASRHRESERYHRHKQLALESVNSFIEDLEQDAQKQLKRDMADAFFIRADVPVEKGDVHAFRIADEFKELINKISKVRT